MNLCRKLGFGILVFGALSFGATIGGSISGFLKVDDSPYIVTETLVLGEGKALVVEAGTQLHFMPETGLDVQGGSLLVMGSSNQPVFFKSAVEGKKWNGISISSTKPAEFSMFSIQNAEIGIAVENGSITLSDGNFENSAHIGFFLKSGEADIQRCSFDGGKNAGVWASKDAKILIDESNFTKNNKALVVGASSSVSLSNSDIKDNDIGVINMGGVIDVNSSLVSENKIGIKTEDVLSEKMTKAVQGNQLNLSNTLKAFDLGYEPENPYASTFKREKVSYGRTQDKSWKVSGNVGSEMGYHAVFMHNNNYYDEYVFGKDTVKQGQRFINYFQVPGFFAGINAYLLMESPTGQTMEFSADIAGDSWNQFDARMLQFVYTDSFQKFVLGDFFLNAGELYMNGVPILGGLYNLNLFNNRVGQPLFSLAAFWGESRKPLVEGKRNYDIYKDYIEEGEAEPQEMMTGLKVRWNMHRRFNGTLGFIGSKDYVEDPILRDGNEETTNLGIPKKNSKTVFADGNWLFFPGDVELNGQIAMGAADTSDAASQRAINEVFAEAGVDGSNFALLNKLMRNPLLINSLKEENLEKIFGDNSMMTASEMRSRLRSLLEIAKEQKGKYEREEDSPGDAQNWDGQNLAFSGSLNWSNKNTKVGARIQFIGEKFYSAGSPDLTQNSRKFGAFLEQGILDFWNLKLSYDGSVDNAASGNDYNIFGLGEGTKWGFFTGAENEWLKEHEQDPVRALYVHDVKLKNEFKLNNQISLSAGYAMNYRTRYTSQRLLANYEATSGIYSDDYFRPSKRPGEGKLPVAIDEDTIYVDSARWAAYNALASEPYLATQFEENLIKHVINLGVTWSIKDIVVKAGGVWTIREDMSEFEQDDALKGISFSDKTYGILGYYFNGGNYFEQKYPISVSLTYGNIKNRFDVVPRYKIYNRDDMTEFEWSLNDEVEIPLIPNYFVLNLNCGLRQLFLDRELDGEDASESETDFDGSAALKVFHSDRLTSDWKLGVYMNYRPDRREDDYRDLYGMVSVNYAF